MFNKICYYSIALKVIYCYAIHLVTTRILSHAHYGMLIWFMMQYLLLIATIIYTVCLFMILATIGL